MKYFLRHTRLASCLVAVLCAALGNGQAQTGTAAELDPLKTTSNWLRRSGATGGICVVAGTRSADLPLAIARQGEYVVHCLYGSPKLLERSRDQVRTKGLAGRISAEIIEPKQLPFAENLINFAVVDSFPDLQAKGLALSELIRVLEPLGSACIGTSSPANSSSRAWAKKLATQLRVAGMKEVAALEDGGTWIFFRKPWPPDIDEWTHYLHGPDGNPVANDRVVGPPRRYQWLSGPKWVRSHETDSSITTFVTARGRLLSIIDEGPISLTGDHDLPDKWFLEARDAFNGVPLWKVPIRRWGWREWKPSWFNTRPGDVPLNVQKRLVAVEDRVYITLGYVAPVAELDARTGEFLKSYPGTERTNEILYRDGTLILSVLTGKGAKVMAVDAASGKQRWVTPKIYRGTTVDYVKWKAMHGSTKAPKLDPAFNIATDGKVVALVDGSEIVCLDYATGKEKWHSAFPSAEADETAGGMRALNRLWVGTMIVSDGVVVHASPNQLAGLDARTGKLLWKEPKKYIGHLWYEWKDVFVIDHLVWTWSVEMERGEFDIGRKRIQRSAYPTSVNGYDVKTGRLVRKVPLGNIFKANHHHRCYRNKATVRYILASRRGSEYVDLHGGKHTVDNWIRGLCHVGMMPANGLQYAPPHPCSCYLDEKLSGMNVLAPASATGQAPSYKGERLMRGPAFGKVPASKPDSASRSDWPTFRHDFMRTGSSPAKVPAKLKLRWRIRAGLKVSPPVVANGKLFAALTDEHYVLCLDASSGKKLWEFPVAARVDSPPTVDRGLVLFGSADGRVYCLRATDGQLVWRFQAAPGNRMIGAYGQLESAWPVHGCVVVQNGTVYFSAGRSSQVDGGITFYGLDPFTGTLRYQTKLEGPFYNVDNVEQNFRLPMGVLSDVLMADAARIYMRNRTFDHKLQPLAGRPALRPRSGFLDGTYFKRMTWTFNGRDPSRLIVHDQTTAYYVRMFDSLRGLDPSVYFTPGTKGYLLFAKGIKEKKNRWAGRVPIRIRAMVATPDKLFVAGPPDLVDPRDPLGAFESREGGKLAVIDAAEGKKLSEIDIPYPPVFNGAAAARGCFYLADTGGSIACFGK